MKASNDIYIAAAFLGRTQVTELILSLDEKNPTAPPEYYDKLLKLSKPLFESPRPYRYDPKTKSYTFFLETPSVVDNMDHRSVTLWTAKDFFSRAAINGNRDYTPTWIAFNDLSPLNPYATVIDGEEMPAKCELLENLLEFVTRSYIREYDWDDEGDLEWIDWIDIYARVAMNVNFDFKRMQKSLLGNVQLWNKFSKASSLPIGRFTLNGTTYIGIMGYY